MVREEESAQQTEKFKWLIKEMYKRFPNIRISENRIKEVIVTKEDRDSLVQHGYFIREPMVSGDEEGFQYGLGPNSLNLITSWKNEELTKKIVFLTVAFLTVGVLTLFATIVNVLASPYLTTSLLIILLAINLLAIAILILVVHRVGEV